MKFNIRAFHYLKIENNRCFLYYRTTQSCIRELDKYETEMVISAYNKGLEDGKASSNRR